MLKLDGEAFAVGILSLSRGQSMDLKYDLIAEDGTRRREVRAAYLSYELQIGSMTQADYDALYTRLLTGGGEHMVTLPDGQSDRTFEATVTLGGDTLGYVDSAGVRHFDRLKLSIAATQPWEGSV